MSDVGKGDQIHDDTYNRDKRKRLTKSENRPKLPQCGNECMILYGLHSGDVKRK